MSLLDINIDLKVTNSVLGRIASALETLIQVTTPEDKQVGRKRWIRGPEALTAYSEDAIWEREQLEAYFDEQGFGPEEKAEMRKHIKDLDPDLKALLERNLEQA